MNPIFAGLPVSIFEEMSALAREHQAINLGQGFPDDPGPEDVRRKAAEAVISGWNQYPPSCARPSRATTSTTRGSRSTPRAR
jgi:aspartate/methionine/tyrosine aminotransferase